MRRTLLTAAMLLLATAAHATEYTSGNWTAQYIDKNDYGVRMCGLRTDLTARSGAIGFIMLKVDARANVFLHLYKSNWSLPVGAKIPAQLGFDRAYRYTLTGTVKEPKSIYFMVGTKYLQELFDLIEHSRRMFVGFEQGSERPWSTDMTGSANALKAFQECVLAILPDNSAPTQPYAAPTQPAPAPTQPYAAPTQPFDNKLPIKPVPTVPVKKQERYRQDDGSV